MAERSLVVRLNHFKRMLVRRNWAQSNTAAHRSITVASKLISLFLKRNFRFFSGRLATSVWHLSSSW